MKKPHILSFAAVMSAVFLPFPAAGQSTGWSDEIRPYVEFLQRQHTSPVDYVMGLFDRYDVVILGERDHRDTTQYDLFEQIISDPRFIDRVGHVMSEVGACNQTEQANRILTPEFPDDARFEAEIMDVLRNTDIASLLWDNTNFYQYLRFIYRINKGLPPDRKVTVTFTGPSWSWENTDSLTTEEFWTSAASISRWIYDDILSENAVNALYERFAGRSPRRKALVIFNRPHSYRGYEPRWSYTAADRIMKRFPGRVANVLVNVAQTQYDNGKHGEPMPVHGGKWDAAFAANGHRQLGFDLKGSPFGRDWFDLYEYWLPEVRGKVLYEEMFDGYIYWNPLSRWVLAHGYDGLVDEEFEPELVRRLKIVESDPENATAEDDTVRFFRGGVLDRNYFNRERLVPVFPTDSIERKYEALVDRYLYRR